MSVPTACQSIQDEIDGVRQERDQLQNECQHARPGEKPALVRLIRILNLQIVGLHRPLVDCIAWLDTDVAHLPRQLTGPSAVVGGRPIAQQIKDKERGHHG
jgi:hypothetical protein